MRCDDHRKNIQAWIDGELDEDGAAELKAHLKTCADCRKRERLLRAVLEALPPPDPVSAGFTEEVLRKAGLREGPFLRAPFRSFRPLVRVTVFASVFAALLAGGILTARRARRGAQVPASADISLDRCVAVRCTAD